jgi:alpha-tubulin suppressor-like RCC1 family protein
MLSVSACVERSEVLSPGESVAAQPPDGGTPPLVSQVSVSNEHTCALSGDVIYCWGDNTEGELGVGSMADRHTPTRLEQTGWKSVHTGMSHTCALSQQGQVHCWGGNERGQLGQGDTTLSRVPVQVELAAPATAISNGFYHTCALLDNGELWCWGDNSEGQLGQNDDPPAPESRAADALLPVLVPTPAVAAGGTGRWTVVNGGEGHTCALQADESLWCWGRNSRSQLGTPTKAEQERSPILVSTDHTWTRLDAGQNHTCALESDGSFWCWGHNGGSNSGSGDPFGNGGDNTIMQAPTRMGTGSWADISTHTFHTCGIDTAAGLWCWGRFKDGQLSTNDELVQLEAGDPDLQISPPLRAAGNVAQVSAGMFTTCFIALDGILYCAGKNDTLQLGEEGRQEWDFLPVSLRSGQDGAGP